MIVNIMSTKINKYVISVNAIFQVSLYFSFISANNSNKWLRSGLPPLLEIRENWKAFFQSGNLVFFSKIWGKSENFDDPIFFLYFDEKIYFYH